MSKKSDARHWYQVHKAHAGSESVERSSAVSAARASVRLLELRLLEMKVHVSTSISSTIRRSLFGLNSLEEQVRQLETQLLNAKSTLLAAETTARKLGEQAYGSDWAARNPDRAK